MLHYFLLTTFLLGSNAFPSSKDLPTVSNIVGGNPANIQDYPYAVSILDEQGLYCGGAIITNFHVVTAGHCVEYSSGALIIHAGSSYWDKEGSYHRIESWVVLGSYKNPDLAVITVRDPFNFDDTCQPIELFKHGEEPEPGTTAVVLGWGETSPKANDISEQLMVIQVPIIDRNECNEIYANSTIGEIDPGEICAGYLDKGGKDACQGDSGGPLVIDNRLAGIIIMGKGCARAGSPGVYTDIGYYSEWINEQISK